MIKLNKGEYERAFTIVELLIVVVVIAILAAITIVSYNGVTNSATKSMMQAELSSLKKQFDIMKVRGQHFPADLSEYTSGNDKILFQYDYDNELGTYCITATSPAVVDTYFASDMQSVTVGLCGGHIASPVPEPVFAYENLRPVGDTKLSDTYIPNVATNYDGSVAIASTVSSSPGNVYITRNSGEDWNAIEQFSGMRAGLVAISDNGEKIIVSVGETVSTQEIYISTDTGVTWVKSEAAGARNWTAVAIRPDGSQFMVGWEIGHLLSSTDGTNWETATSSMSTARWRSIALTNSGVSLASAGCGTNRGFAASADGGETWSSRTTNPHCSNDIAISGDGQKILIARYRIESASSTLMYGIGYSSDGGVTWEDWHDKVPSASNRPVNSLFVSRSGQVMFAGRGALISAPIWYSTDYGETWTNAPSSWGFNKVVSAGNGAVHYGLKSQGVQKLIFD